MSTEGVTHLSPTGCRMYLFSAMIFHELLVIHSWPIIHSIHDLATNYFLYSFFYNCLFPILNHCHKINIDSTLVSSSVDENAQVKMNRSFNLVLKTPIMTMYNYLIIRYNYLIKSNLKSNHHFNVVFIFNDLTTINLTSIDLILIDLIIIILN